MSRDWSDTFGKAVVFVSVTLLVTILTLSVGLVVLALV